MSFEVFLNADGEPKWRIRDEDGNIVKIKPGRVCLPADPVGNRRSKVAMRKILKKMALSSPVHRKV